MPGTVSSAGPAFPFVWNRCVTTKIEEPAGRDGQEGWSVAMSKCRTSSREPSFVQRIIAGIGLYEDHVRAA